MKPVIFIQKGQVKIKVQQREKLIWQIVLVKTKISTNWREDNDWGDYKHTMYIKKVQE